ncbi:glycosyltransferase involved in cell wall biosynthesis [Caldicoprobacter guelmensis]|uniref:glycosyltransferase family 4 protein n=1 Tax=Caldicoprobacter guelmensis TaxID=1170224 RepID=UPI0019560FC2|nr:glycosyltransferase family 4 protein [Caldicoprobacter guelmensis]MBM7581716.1 glycosyltransferase involved in cell wall biosynthesis [Caldicoprobacter guelmensis]
MNILYINHYAGSPTHGMEYRPYYLAREWLISGHKVTVVAASYSHLRSKNPYVVKELEEEFIDGIKYVWLKTPTYKGNNIKRVMNMFSFVWKLFRISRKVAEDIKPDAVIASSTYPLDIYPAYRIANFSGAKLVFEVHDLWPLTPMELGGMSKWHPFIVILQKAEDFAYKHADRVVSVLPKALDYMVSRGLAPEKFAYIPNGIDTDEWETLDVPLPSEHMAVIEGLKGKGYFIVGYAGSHGIANALDYFIESARYFENLPVAFILVGQGPEKERIQKYVVENQLRNVIFLPPVPKECIPNLLRKMDALYIGWRKNRLYRFGISPNKLFDYMMAGKPVIHAVEAGNDPVVESGCGISIPPEDPIAIAEAVKRIMDMPAEERNAMGLKGREYVLKNHSYNVLAKRFIEAIKG